MPKLYEITNNFRMLESFDMDTDGDVTAFIALAKEVDASFDEKAENICKLIRNIESDAEAFKVEKLKLEKKQKALENKADALKDYLEFNARAIMQEGEKRKAGLFTLSFRKNHEKLVYDSEDGIPDRFYKQAVDVSLLKEAVKNGETFPGVRLERTETLQIKL